MKNWIQSKLIWHVMLTDKETGELVQSVFFIFRRSADRFVKKYYEKAEEVGCNISYGGEPLWFW